MQRRRICLATASSLWAWPAWVGAAPELAARPQRQPGAPVPFARLHLMIASPPGGGVDRVGRALGEALLAVRLAEAVDYENVGGKAGTIGLTRFVEQHHADPHAILVSGMPLLGGIALHQPSVDLTRVSPLARLTSEHLVLVVPAASPIASGRELAALLQDTTRRTTLVGGSLAGADHLLFGLIRQGLSHRGIQLDYMPAADARAALQALASGQAQVGVSDFSEVQALVRSGVLRALAISSRRSLHGLPSLRELGLQAELSNWRGLFAPAGIDADAAARLRSSIDALARSLAWQRALESRELTSHYRPSNAFRDDIEVEQAVVRVVMQVLKLKKPVDDVRLHRNQPGT